MRRAYESGAEDRFHAWRKQVKYQRPEQQMAVRREDRVRLVSMDAEKKQPVKR